MSIFRQILQALLDILAEVRLLRQEAADIEKGVEELVQDATPNPTTPTAIEIDFNKPTHK